MKEKGSGGVFMIWRPHFTGFRVTFSIAFLFSSVPSLWFRMSKDHPDPNLYLMVLEGRSHGEGAKEDAGLGKD